MCTRTHTLTGDAALALGEGVFGSPGLGFFAHSDTNWRADDFHAEGVADLRLPEVEPDNTFELGGLKGKGLTLTVPAPGTVEVRNAGGARGAAKRKRLKPSSATATGAGKVTVRLKLTRKAKKKLKQKGKVKVNAAITFTPVGGTPNTEDKKFKLVKQ